MCLPGFRLNLLILPKKYLNRPGPPYPQMIAVKI